MFFTFNINCLSLTFLRSYTARILQSTANNLRFSYSYFFYSLSIMACSLTVAALLHPWSGRLDVASRLPIFAHEWDAVSKIWAKPEGSHMISSQKKRKHKRVSIDLPWILRNQGSDVDRATMTVTKKGEITRMMAPTRDTARSDEAVCECCSYDINETPPPETQECDELEESVGNYTDFNLEMLNIAEAALIPLPTRKTSRSPIYHNEYFQVAESSVAGWGAFATRDLTKGDVILREIPLFVSENDDVFHEFYKLDKNAMNVALSLHSHQLIKGGTPRILGVWRTNCFAITHNMAGLFPIAARFNHACHPINNVEYQFDHDNNTLIMMAREDITAGQELTISYVKDWNPQLLYLCYGFRCRCGYCKGLDDEDTAIFTTEW
ncbi:hypothetical protein V8C37DRAFT_371608 [Trichoderma ceciliae]